MGYAWRRLIGRERITDPPSRKALAYARARIADGTAPKLRIREELLLPIVKR